MGLLDFFKKKKSFEKKTEQAIIINFQYGKTDLTDLFDLEDKLDDFLNIKNIGELDGHEIAIDGSDGYLYLYGPDAELLYDAIKPILKDTFFMMKAKVYLRLGHIDDHNAKRIDLILE